MMMSGCDRICWVLACVVVVVIIDLDEKQICFYVWGRWEDIQTPRMRLSRLSHCPRIALSVH